MYICMYAHKDRTSLCSKLPLNSGSSCFCLPSTGIEGVCHHTRPLGSQSWKFLLMLDFKSEGETELRFGVQSKA